jgi:hypothetical protein
MKKLFLGLAFIASTSVFASVKGGKLGVNFSYAASTPSFGAWWHITDMIAITPSVGYTNKTTTYSASETASSDLVFGIGVPIYLAKFNILDMYVSPAFSYTTSSTKTTTAAGSASGTSSALGFSASLGLQVALNDQIHFFGELGFGYSKNDPGSTTATTGPTTTIGTTRTAVGAIFYFN